MSPTSTPPKHVYEVYIRTTPERLGRRSSIPT